MTSLQQRVDKEMRTVMDFPKEGIAFKDITTLMLNPSLITEIIDSKLALYKDKGITAIVGIEARGFLFGFALAERLGIKFVPARKSGKLPADVYTQSYALEYGEAIIELHKDGLHKDDIVLIHDDLLATGGTAAAAASIIEHSGARLHGFDFIVELGFLNGRESLNKLTDLEINSLISYN